MTEHAFLFHLDYNGVGTEMKRNSNKTEQNEKETLMNCKRISVEAFSCHRMEIPMHSKRNKPKQNGTITERKRNDVKNAVLQSMIKIVKQTFNKDEM